jgi:hypothetical protein
VRAVVLENVPAGKLPSGGLAALASFVEDFGGGLLMTGGKASFGAGGYRRSRVEDVLPITLEVRQEQRRFALAMAIALDRSGSMSAATGDGRTKMDLADLGACAAVELLGPRDSLSVIAVDSAPHVVVPITPIADADGIMERIRSIESQGGGIFIGEALHAAADQLAAAPQQNKHIVLFADAADSEEPTDYATFVPALVDAGVTVSVIGLGSESDSDAKLLQDIARLGGGRVFFTSDASDLPRVFAEETIQVARSSFVEEPTPGRMLPDLIGLGEMPAGEFPTLGGYSVGYVREGTTVGVLGEGESDEPVPLLSFRQAGLGALGGLPRRGRRRVLRRAGRVGGLRRLLHDARALGQRQRGLGRALRRAAARRARGRARDRGRARRRAGARRVVGHARGTRRQQPAAHADEAQPDAAAGARAAARLRAPGAPSWPRRAAACCACRRCRWPTRPSSRRPSTRRPASAASRRSRRRRADACSRRSRSCSPAAA